ncbi:putative F-box domain, leucine-rich repeat domain superfamily, F-box-like domain superfamily [Helianthus debilis subsp. tardiflorus]
MDQQKALNLKRSVLGASQFKHIRKVKRPKRNWLDLPSEITANILHRIGVFDIFQNAQKVCTTWREICKDPAIWRVIYVDASFDTNANHAFEEMCKRAIDRSQGQLVDITIVRFRNEEILEYIANRSSQLKRLTIACCDDFSNRIWTTSLVKFPLLEELSLYATNTSTEGIETAGRYCSKLKTLKVNQENYRFWDYYSDGEYEPNDFMDDWIATAIGENLHELRHLELIGSPMTNEGLKMILDGCHHLELLDLRRCLFLHLGGDLWKRCLQQIKCVKLPNHFPEGCPFIYKTDEFSDEFGGFCQEYYEESEGGSDEESEGGSDEESEGGSDE